jgi:hypothetical protein
MIDFRAERKPNFTHDLGPHVEGRVSLLPRFERQFRPEASSSSFDIHIALLNETPPDEESYILVHAGGGMKGNKARKALLFLRISFICQPFAKESRNQQNHEYQAEFSGI